MSSRYTETPDADACATAPVSASPVPAHTVRVTPDGLEVDGALVRPDAYELAQKPARGSLILEFRNVSVTDDAAEPEREVEQAVTVKPGTTYVSVQINAQTVEDGVHRLTRFREALPAHFDVHGEVRVG